jgi:hypothetical protein
MNRTVLLIPALCGKLTDTTVTQTLRQASQADIEAWEKKHIPYTVRKKRFDNITTDQQREKSQFLLKCEILL